MKRPSKRLTTQTVTIFTPVIETGTPINGAYSQSWVKTVLNGVKYTINEDKALHIAVYDVATFPDVMTGKSIVVLGNYTGNTPPYEGTDTQYYLINQVNYRYADNGQLHNIGVDAN